MSQQVFQHSFHKGMPWHGKPLHLQIFHSILQVVLAPFMVIMWVFVWMGKNAITSYLLCPFSMLFGTRFWMETVIASASPG